MNLKNVKFLLSMVLLLSILNACMTQPRVRTTENRTTQAVRHNETPSPETIQTEAPEEFKEKKAAEPPSPETPK